MGGGDSQSQRSLPCSSSSPSPEAPAWRLEDYAVGTSGEQLLGQGQSGSRGTGRTALEPTRPRLPGEAVGKVPDMYPNPRSVDTRAHEPHSPSQPLPQEPDHLGSTPHPSCVIYLKQVTQLLWASVTSAVRET